MKISSFMMITLLIGLVFFIFTSVINDMQSQYPLNNLNQSAWNTLYDSSYTSYLNTSATDLQHQLEEINDQDNWFTNVGQGLVAIPSVLLNVFKIAIGSMTNLISLFTNGASRYVPSEVMVFGTIALLIIVVISLINWWHSKSQA